MTTPRFCWPPGTNDWLRMSLPLVSRVAGDLRTKHVNRCRPRKLVPLPVLQRVTYAAQQSTDRT